MAKHIWKVAVVAMALAMSLVLTACGSGGSSSAASSASGSASASTSASAASTSASAASTSAASASMTGKINGDTYQNDFFGVKYTLPAGYKYYTEQELAEMNGVSAGTDPSEIISKGALYSDAVAYKDDGSNVIFGIQYEPQGASYTADAYADESLKQLKSQLAAGGITLVDSQKGEYTHGATGAKYPAIRLKLEKDGTEYNEQMLFFKTEPNYFFVVNATAANESALDDMLCNVEQTK